MSNTTSNENDIDLYEEKAHNQTHKENVEKLEKLHSQNVNLLDLSRDVEHMKSTLSHFYIPKHFDSLMKKVGTMEQNILRAQESMNTCYHVTFFIVILFLILTFATVYIIWRMNYFKLVLRQNKFGRYTRPKSCYACYRPWRKTALRNTENVSKGSFSSPELISDYKTPRPPLTKDVYISSDSEY